MTEQMKDNLPRQAGAGEKTTDMALACRHSMGLLALVTVGVVAVGIVLYKNVDAVYVGADDNGRVEVQVDGASIVADPDYVEIHDSRVDGDESSFKTYLNGLLGANVEWTGYVESVDDNGQVWINMDRPGSGDEAPDVFIRLSENDQKYSDVQQYEHDQKITFNRRDQGI